MTCTPPSEEELKKVRLQREKDKKMFDALREIIFHVMFVIVLLIVSYSFRDPNGYLLKSGLSKTVVDLEFSFNNVSGTHVCGGCVRAHRRLCLLYNNIVNDLSSI